MTTRAQDHLQLNLKELAVTDCNEVVEILERISMVCQDVKVNLQERYDTLGDVKELPFKIHGYPKYVKKAIDAWRKLYESTDGVSISRLMTATKAAALQQRISGDYDRAAQVYLGVIQTFLQVVSLSDTRSEQIWKVRLLSRLNMRALNEALLAQMACRKSTRGYGAVPQLALESSALAKSQRQRPRG